MAPQRSNVINYESAPKANKFILIVHGANGEASRAHEILRKTEPIELGCTATEDLRLLRASSAAANLKVVRSALQNAASVARLLLTAEALITETPEKKGTSRLAAPGF